MRIVVFGPERRVGLWQERDIIDVNHAVTAYLTHKSGASQAAARAARAAPADLLSYIEAGTEALDLTRAAAEHVSGATDPTLVQPYDTAKIWAPWPRRRIACAGANYTTHVVAIQRNYRGRETTREQVEKNTRSADPIGFWKVPLEVMGPDADIIYPTRSTRFDYEAELTVVFGRAGKHISASQARRHIWGITLANDWSDRDQLKAPTTLSFNLMKNFDCCLSLGPSILVDESDIQNLDVSLTVNGERRQNYNTSEMIYSFAEYIEFLSRDLTLAPGDMLLGGTGEGTALDSSELGLDGKSLPDRFLKPGDLVEISCERIGLMRNRIVRPPG